MAYFVFVCVELLKKVETSFLLISCPLQCGRYVKIWQQDKKNGGSNSNFLKKTNKRKWKWMCISIHYSYAHSRSWFIKINNWCCQFSSCVSLIKINSAILWYKKHYCSKNTVLCGKVVHYTQSHHFKSIFNVKWFSFGKKPCHDVTLSILWDLKINTQGLF